MRLFVAIELDEEVRRRLARQRDGISLAGCRVRMTPVEQIHLTLRFLGKVEDGRVASVSDAAKSAAAQTKPFDMMIQGAGCFPPRGRVRVIWAGVASPIESVIACFDALEAALEERGFDREARPFSPHITLGRVADDRSNGRLRRTVMSYGIGVSRGIEVSHGIGPLVQSVDSLAVMQSRLSSSGAIHTPVSTHEFVTHEL